MNQSEIHFLQRSLAEAGAVKDNQHIILSNGLHTRKYYDFTPGKLPRKDRMQLLQWVSDTVEHFITEETVFLGAGCGRWYADQVAFRFQCDSIYAEKLLSGNLGFTRDQGSVLTSRPVIIVDDVFVEGTTMVNLLSLAQAFNGKPVTCTVFLNRSGKVLKHPSGLYVPMQTMYEEVCETWAEAHCPMCKAGVPFSTQHGKGAEIFHLRGQPQP